MRQTWPTVLTALSASISRIWSRFGVCQTSSIGTRVQGTVNSAIEATMVETGSVWARRLALMRDPAMATALRAPASRPC